MIKICFLELNEETGNEMVVSVSIRTAVREGYKAHPRYVSAKEAVTDFMIVHWAWFCDSLDQIELWEMMRSIVVERTVMFIAHKTGTCDPKPGDPDFIASIDG